MDDQRLGATIRAVRLRRGWRQVDLAVRSRVSPSTISRLERGHPGSLTLDMIRRVAGALDVRVDLVARWRAGDLDRLLNARHSQLHELVARWFGKELPAWILAPEVSYAIYRERGVVDIVAWHPGRRAILVIELKTDIVDINQLIGKVGEKARLIRRSSAIAVGTRSRFRPGSSLPAAGPIVPGWRRTGPSCERRSRPTVERCGRGCRTRSGRWRRSRSGRKRQGGS